MNPAYVGLGSNLEDPVRQITLAFELLDGIDDTQLVARSSLYESAPFGPVEQPNFINAVALLDTKLDYEKETLDYLERHACDYDMFIDIGANVGIFSLFFSFFL